MTSERWIVVPNWEKLQHYSERDPAWIKLYTELGSDDNFRRLSASERGLLMSIWVEFARARGVLPVRDLAARTGLRADSRALASLNDAGWIALSASKPRAHARARSREKRRDREEVARVPAREGPSKSKKPKSSKAKTQTWIDNTAHELGELSSRDLERVIGDEYNVDDPETVADLVAYATERIKSI